MGFLQNVVAFARTDWAAVQQTLVDEESRATKIQEAEGEIIRFFSGLSTTSGIRVDVDEALKIPAVRAAVGRIAEFLAALPLKLFRRQGERGKIEERSHPLSDIVGQMPNPLMDSLVWRETMQSSASLRSNAYSQIIRNGFGEIAEIWPLKADQMEVRSSGRNVSYRYTREDGSQRNFSNDQILHIKWFSMDGIMGTPLLDMAGNSFGLALAIETYASNYMKNEAAPSGLLKLTRRLKDEAARRRLEQSWRDSGGRYGEKQGLRILEEGSDYQAISNKPDESQLVEERKYQVTEAARWFNIPPHLIADLERATFSNVEEQQREFIMFTMLPWLVRWERALDTQLLTREERQDLFFKFEVQGLLRGDAKSRAEFYGSARQWGWMNTNEIRGFEDMNPIDNGDIYLQPVNMVEAGTEPGGGDDSDEGEAFPFFRDEQRQRGFAGSRRDFAVSMQDAFETVWRQVVVREQVDVDKMAKRHLRTRDQNSFEEALRVFYGDDHRQFIIDRTSPLYRPLFRQVRQMLFNELGFQLADDLLDQFFTRYMDNLAQDYAQDSEGQLLAVIRDAIQKDRDLQEAINERTAQWVERRPEKQSREETLRGVNALTLEVFNQSRMVSRARWVAFGDTCPFCQMQNGRTIPLGTPFVRAGDNAPGADGQTMASYRNVRHPPLHQGCDCQIVPG